MVKFDVLAPKIEKAYRVKLYYKPEWFGDKLFRENLAESSLEDCLAILKHGAELNVIKIMPGSYVFVPVEVRNYSYKTNSKGVLLIGEMEDAGINAKATISGKVSDVYTGKPLKGAVVNIEELKISSVTDKDGNYKFTVPVGKYDLALNYAGFEEDNRKINVYGNGIVDFEMSEKTIRLKEVMVSDKVANQNVTSSQMSSIKLNAKMIKELPLFLGEKDIIKSIKLLPGVQSTGEFGTGFFVRGGSQDQNLIMIEDVPVFNSAHLFGLISVINSDGVNNVTLLKSGIPAKFGERASSVMDIRMGTNPDKASFKGGIGLMDTRMNLEMPFWNKKASLLIGARTSYSNWLLHKMPDLDLKNSSASFYDVNALLTIRPNPKNKIVIYGYYSDDKYSLSNSYDYHYDNAIGSLQYTHLFSEKFHSTFMIGASRYRNDMCELDTLKPAEGYKIYSSINYNNTKLDFNWRPDEKHSVNFGLNGILYRLQPGIMVPFGSLSETEKQVTQKEKSLEMSVYLSDNINFSSKLSSEVGLRFTRYASLGPGNVLTFGANAARTSGNIADTLHYAGNKVINWYSSLEPRLSMRYSLDEYSSLKLSYNRISQFINLISNSMVMAPTDVYKLSSPNVKPVVCDQIAMGYFRNFSHNAWEASVELYYKKLQNILEYRNGAEIVMNNALEADLLNASGYNYGLELYLKKNAGRLTGWASYTYSRSMRHTTSPYELDQINGNRYFPSTFDQPHNIVFVGNYHLTRRISFSSSFTYNTGKPVTLPELKYEYDGRQYIYYSDRNKYRLSDYHRLDIAVTLDESLRLKKKWKGSWTFSILNLYAQKNPYSVFYKSTSNVESKFYQTFNLYKMYIIARPIPTLTYNFSF
jgi:Outer membrane receptor proteins, mostly Fe transport